MATVKLIDSFTSELVSYESTTTWYDGTPMDDSKVDGVIYRKRGGVYYRRAFTGPVNVKWFGAKGDGITDDTQALEKAINFIKSDIEETLYIPIGVYIYSVLPNLAIDSLKIEGQDYTKTVLKYTGSSQAVIIDGFALPGDPPPYKERINISGLTIEGNSNTLVLIYMRGLGRCHFSNILFGSANATSGICLKMDGCQLSEFHNIGCVKTLNMTSIPYEGLRLSAGSRPNSSKPGGNENVGNCSNNTFYQSYFEGLSIGIRLSGGDQNYFIGGSPEASKVYGVLVSNISRYNIFIGMGFEDPDSTANVSDAGHYTKYINCYSNKLFRISGTGVSISGGYMERIEIQSNAVNTTVEDLSLGNWRNESFNVLPFGIFDSGSNSFTKNIINLETGNDYNDVIQFTGNIKADGFRVKSNTDANNPTIITGVIGGMSPIINSVGTNYPVNVSGVGIAVDRSPNYSDITSIGSFKIWTTNNNSRDFYIRKITDVGQFSPWMKMVTTDNLNSSLPAATTTVPGIVKQATTQADSTGTDLATLTADYNSLLAKLRTAGILAT